MAQLGIARGHLDHAPILQMEGHPSVLYGRHLGGLAVEQAESVVAGPEDMIASAQLHLLALVNLDPAVVRKTLAQL